MVVMEENHVITTHFDNKIGMPTLFYVHVGISFTFIQKTLKRVPSEHLDDLVGGAKLYMKTLFPINS